MLLFSHDIVFLNYLLVFSHCILFNFTSYNTWLWVYTATCLSILLTMNIWIPTIKYIHRRVIIGLYSVHMLILTIVPYLVLEVLLLIDITYFYGFPTLWIAVFLSYCFTIPLFTFQEVFNFFSLTPKKDRTFAIIVILCIWKHRKMG